MDIISSSGRIILKYLSVSDAAALFAYRSVPGVYRYQGWLPSGPEDAAEFIRRYSSDSSDSWHQFGIYPVSGGSGRLIGDCGFCMQEGSRCEIGYTIAPGYQRRGLGSDAVFTLVSYLFAHTSVREITASTDPENSASVYLLERLGFTGGPLKPASVLIRGEWKDDLEFTLTRERSEERQ